MMPPLSDNESESLLPPDAPFTLTRLKAFVDALESNLEAQAESLAGAGPNPNDKRLAVLAVQQETLASFGTQGNLVAFAGSKTSDKKVKDQVARMEEAARDAYVQALRDAPPTDLQQGGSLNRDQIMAFFDAAVAYVSTEAGRNRLEGEFKKAEGRGNRQDGKSGVRLVTECVIDIQKEMLECCGIEADFGVSQLGQLRENFSGDEEVMARLEAFVKSMGDASSRACKGAETMGKIEHDDGVTRVASVKHTEIDPEAPADRGEIRGEMREREQKRELAAAREMAAVQQGILAELLKMDEDERNEVVAKAEIAHIEFVRRTNEIEDVGEKVLFMRTIDSGLQKQLIQFRLWQEMIKNNGGVPPQIVKSNQG